MKTRLYTGYSTINKLQHFHLPCPQLRHRMQSACLVSTTCRTMTKTDMYILESSHGRVKFDLEACMNDISKFISSSLSLKQAQIKLQSVPAKKKPLYCSTLLHLFINNLANIITKACVKIGRTAGLSLLTPQHVCGTPGCIYPSLPVSHLHHCQFEEIRYSIPQGNSNCMRCTQPSSLGI